ncbi:hypothetical protein H6F96_30560 [Microcoleus sp. FACHB-53]|nr:hypothetical protein [Microcoleus sp. FACHB-53]
MHCSISIGLTNDRLSDRNPQRTNQGTDRPQAYLGEEEFIKSDFTPVHPTTWKRDRSSPLFRNRISFPVKM